MGAPEAVSIHKIVSALKSLRHTVNVPLDFHLQMDKVNSLLRNDKTGMVNTVLDFMIKTSTVPMKIETENDTLDNVLKIWQRDILNKNINIGIPRGLNSLSSQYFKERWKSSFIGLRITWGKVKIDETEMIMPLFMWLVDGSSIYPKKDKNNDISKMKYFLDSKFEQELKPSKDESIIIRKPYSSWYETTPTPYLVRRGVLFNALIKEAIINKQADVIESIIPYLLLLKSGTDKLAELNMLVDESEMKQLKKDLLKAKEEHDMTGSMGDLIAPLSYDINFEHLMPDLKKIFDKAITEGTNSNLLAGLGLVELEGFSNNRQETILNPKFLVEEIKDGVSDWAFMLEEVMFQMKEKNAELHKNLSKGTINVIPSIVKAFVTDEMKAMIRSIYDRGLVSKKSATEAIADFNFEVEVERRTKENEKDLQTTMKPPVIQNIEKDLDPTVDDMNLEDQNKKSGTPEGDNFNQAVLKAHNEALKIKKSKKELILASFENIDQLPDNVKKVLPIGAQVIFLKAFNSDLGYGHDEESTFKVAWSAVQKVYKKNKDDKWVKK